MSEDPECCSLEHKEIKSLMWEIPSFSVTYCVCECACMVYGCVHLPACDQSQNTLQSPWVSAACASSLPDRIKPLREHVDMFFISDWSAAPEAAQHKTSLAPASHFSLPGVRGIWGGIKTAPSQYELAHSLSLEQRYDMGKRGGSRAANSPVA